MSDQILESSHFARAQEELPHFFRKPRILALLEAGMSVNQILEEEAFDSVSASVGSATGPELDAWASMVNEQRDGLTDIEFRPFVEARALAIRSKGTVDDLTQIFRTITRAHHVRYFHHYPLGFRLTAFVDGLMSEPMRRKVRRFMDTVRPAGRSMELTETVRSGEIRMTVNASPNFTGFGRTLSRVI